LSEAKKSQTVFNTGSKAKPQALRSNFSRGHVEVNRKGLCPKKSLPLSPRYADDWK